MNETENIPNETPWSEEDLNKFMYEKVFGAPNRSKPRTMWLADTPKNRQFIADVTGRELEEIDIMLMKPIILMPPANIDLLFWVKVPPEIVESIIARDGCFCQALLEKIYVN